MEKNNEKLAAASTLLYDHFGNEITDDDIKAILSKDDIKSILSREVDNDRLVKIFVSQPMKHRSDEEIIAERNRLFNAFKNKINELGYEGYRFELIDSFFKDANHSMDVKHEGVWYLAMSFELLATADIAIFANGAGDDPFNSAKGCLLENSACTFYNVPAIKESYIYDDSPKSVEYFKSTVSKALLAATAHKTANATKSNY